MKTVPIPGGTAQVREKGDLRGRDKKLIEAAYLSAGPISSKMLDPEKASRIPDNLPPEEAAAALQAAAKDNPPILSMDETMALLQVKEAAVIATLASWTLDRPLPTLETIGDLPVELYDALCEAVGGFDPKMLANGVMEPSTDRESDFGNSRFSDGPSQDPAENPSTLELPNAGESTATESSIQG